MTRCLLLSLIVAGLVFADGLHGQARDGKSSVEDLLRDARKAVDAGQLDKARSLCDRAIEQDPKKVDAYVLRGSLLDRDGKNAEALRDFSMAIALDPMKPISYHLRGCTQFKLGKINESIADFDRFLELDPKSKPSHWQRGISYYYAGRFEEGKQQFEGYQTFDSNDVENAVWRFMCQAKKDGIAKSRKDMLKIGNDQRLPMKEVYDLFMGKAEPKDVLAAAEKKPTRAQDDPRFYAHLYLGIYYDMMGDKRKALEHLNKATDDYRHRRYMWDVARVHRDILRKAK